MSFRCRFAQHETGHIFTGVVYSILQQCAVYDKQNMIWTCQLPSFKISPCLNAGLRNGHISVFSNGAIWSKIHAWGQHKCFIHNNGDAWSVRY